VRAEPVVRSDFRLPSTNGHFRLCQALQLGVAFPRLALYAPGMASHPRREKADQQARERAAALLPAHAIRIANHKSDSRKCPSKGEKCLYEDQPARQWSHSRGLTEPTCGGEDRARPLTRLKGAQLEISRNC
jgi:hypothetical protein